MRALVLWASLLCSAAPAAEPGPTVVVEESLALGPAAAWTAYGIHLADAAKSGTVGFESEVAARAALVQVWTELQDSQPRAKRPSDAYLDALVQVERAGFLRAYVWVFLREFDWQEPDRLDVERFTRWKAANLQGHEARTFAAVTPAPAPIDAERAEALAAQAKIALDTGSIDRARDLASQALRANPDHVGALFTRATVALAVKRAQTDPDAARRITELASRDMSRVVRVAPQSFEASVILQTFGKRPGLALPRVQCPQAAVDAFAEAEAHFINRDLTDALAAYDRGLALCPDDADHWVYSGDALYGLGDRGRAIERYEKAIALVPCHWQAHRFKGDVLMRVQPAASRGSFIQALACNPGYDTAWTTAGDRRVKLRRPGMVEGTADLDRTGVEPELSGVYDTWLATYAARVQASDPDADFVALAAAVAVWRTQHPGGGVGPWAVLAEAQAAGLLREAMFIHFFAPDLIPAFLPYRDAHLDRLVKYLDLHVLPPFQPPE